MGLTGWNPKRRPHRVVAPQYSDAELNQSVDWFTLDNFEREEVLTTRGKLLERFYRLNNFEDDCNAWITMQLDPDKYTAPKQHFWFFGHYGDYYVLIDLSMFGTNEVHRIRLFYRQDNGRRLWLASAQAGPCYFYSQERMATEYMRVLHRKEFYINPKNLNRVVAM